MARSVSTATTAVPPAAITAPTSPPEPGQQAAVVAGALQLGDPVADEPSGGAGEEDRGEGQDSGPDRR